MGTTVDTTVDDLSIEHSSIDHDSGSTTPYITGRVCMLTTIDNPYNPFTHWDEWLKYDRDQGYYTNEYLARTVPDDDSLSDDQLLQATEEAMRYISETNPTGIWVIRYK